MTSPEELFALVRTKHGRHLDRLRRTSLSDAGSTVAMNRTGTGRNTSRYEARSVLDRMLDVRNLASRDLIGGDPDFVGDYPTGSKLMFVSLSARHARTGSIASIDPDEADASSAALAPQGYEEVVLELGQIATSQSKATHYRQIVGPDNHLCAIDERDRTSMLTSAFFI